MRPKHLIDFHVHCFPEHIAEKAAVALVERYQVQPRFIATPAGLVEQMDKNGVEVSVILPVATRPAQVESINNWVASVQSDRIVSFGAIHPDMADPVAEVERLISLGIKGIKLQPQWQDFYPDAPKLEPLLRAAEGKLIITFHAGDEIAPAGDLKSTPDRLANVHHKFPNLIMVAAHFGGFRVFDAVEKHLIGQPNVYLDTSYCPPEDLPDARMIAMIRAHGAQKILFATDAPFGDPAADLQRLLNLGLSQDEIEDICWRNAARLLGLAL